MRDSFGWSPTGIDLSLPAVGRMYDYLLGGAHNFAIDRAAVERAVAALPFLPLVARANRDFLRRAVLFMIGEGVDQFLDLGSGIPTVGNVHQIAQRANPNARTVYVDIDPVAVAHAHALLHDDPNSAAVLGDLRHYGQVLADPAVQRLIDWGRPVGVLMVAVLHFIPDHDDPGAVIAAYRTRMASGSYLALSHASRDGQPAELDAAVDAAARAYDDTGTGLVFRTSTQLAQLMDGFSLVAPGIVQVPNWRPERGTDADDPDPWRHGLAGLGHVPDAQREGKPCGRDTAGRPTNRRVLEHGQNPGAATASLPPLAAAFNATAGRFATRPAPVLHRVVPTKTGRGHRCRRSFPEWPAR